jgi:hypothetical protein
LIVVSCSKTRIETFWLTGVEGLNTFGKLMIRNADEIAGIFRNCPPASLTNGITIHAQGVTPMNETKETSLALNVRLKAGESSAHPRAANYTNVGVAQGIAYVDFGFIEPALLGAIANTVKNGQGAPKGIEGQLVTRVAMGVDVLARLHRQIQQVLVSMRDARQGKGKG